MVSELSTNERSPLVLPTTTISMSQVAAELGISQTGINLNDSRVRALAGAGGSGTPISMSQLRGKSSTYKGKFNLRWQAHSQQYGRFEMSIKSWTVPMDGGFGFSGEAIMSGPSVTDTYRLANGSPFSGKRLRITINDSFVTSFTMGASGATHEWWDLDYYGSSLAAWFANRNDDSETREYSIEIEVLS